MLVFSRFSLRDLCTSIKYMKAFICVHVCVSFHVWLDRELNCYLFATRQFVHTQQNVYAAALKHYLQRFAITSYILAALFHVSSVIECRSFSGINTVFAHYNKIFNLNTSPFDAKSRILRRWQWSRHIAVLARKYLQLNFNNATNTLIRLQCNPMQNRCYFIHTGVCSPHGTPHLYRKYFSIWRISRRTSFLDVVRHLELVQGLENWMIHICSISIVK